MIRDFSLNEFFYLLDATRYTIYLSVLTFLFGGIAGLMIALARTSGIRLVERIAAAYILIFQGTPVLMQIFLAFFGVALLGVDVPAFAAGVFALSLNAAATLGEIWRGCIQAVPKGQTEGATALGLNYVQRMRYVILPQALKISLAPTVGFLVLLIKTTSLVALIGILELSRAAQIVNNITYSPGIVFGIVSTIYFVICWPLSLLSSHLERKMRN